MESMALEEKVDTLEGSPELQVKKFVSQLRAEKERIVAETVEDLKLQAQSFEPPRQTPELKPIDWSGLEKSLTYVESKTVAELKSDDAGLAKVQEAYDKAGGDAALFKKLHDEWQPKQLEREEELKSSNKRFEASSEKLHGRLNEASSDEAKLREFVEQLKAQYESAKQERDDFQNNASDLTKQELAREKYLKREVPQLEKEYEAAKSRLSTVTTNKESIEKLMNAQKEQNDTVQNDDYGRSFYEPVMSEVVALPLRTKYVKLTGSQPPA
jgi:chromosome segregation ATPase